VRESVVSVLQLHELKQTSDLLLRSFSVLQGEILFIQIEIGKSTHTHTSYDEISTSMIQQEAFESDHSTATGQRGQAACAFWM